MSNKPSLGPAVNIPTEGKDKMKLGRLVDSKGALQRLVAKELPVKTAYKLARFIKSVNAELDTFEEQRVVLVKKYGTEDSNQQITVSVENIPAFVSELSDIAGLEIEIDVPEFSLDDFGNVDITTADLIVLDYLIKD